MIPLADINGGANLEGLIICLLVVALIAAFVYFGCRIAGYPQWGQIGAAVVVIVGALLCLL